MFTYLAVAEMIQFMSLNGLVQAVVWAASLTFTLKNVATMRTKPHLILIIFAWHCAHNMTEGELRENKYGCNAY